MTIELRLVDASRTPLFPSPSDAQSAAAASRPVLVRADIVKLRLRRRRFWSLIASRPSESFEIELSLTETGAQRLAQSSAGAIGRWLALSIDGETIAQAVIREPLTSRTLSLAGSFTHAEAKALAARIASALD